MLLENFQGDEELDQLIMQMCMSEGNTTVRSNGFLTLCARTRESNKQEHISKLRIVRDELAFLLDTCNVAIKLTEGKEDELLDLAEECLKEAEKGTITGGGSKME